MAKLGQGQFIKEINKLLASYSDSVKEGVQEATKDVSKRAVLKLKSNSTGKFNNVSGDYRRGWKAKKVKDAWVIYNATDYGLTHLLEKGHNLVTEDGRKVGEARAFPHIRKVEQESIEELLKEIERVIEG